MSGTEQQAAGASARRLAAACFAALDTPVVSAILHGSLTLDDFQPGRSDLDLLLVVERNLTVSEFDLLVTVVRNADPGPAGGIDLLVVTREAAAAPAERPSLELQVGRYPGPSDDLEVERRKDYVPDLWPELSIARADGQALAGAEPRQVIGEVPFDAVRENGFHWLRAWLDLTDDEENAVHMVPTACRIWRFAAEGRHSSKSAAAGWALEQDPSLDAVGRALGQRNGAATPTIDPSDVRRVLGTVLQRC